MVEYDKKFKPQQKHGLCKHRLFKIWSNMKDRCLREKNTAYKDYGGRGITVCQEWMDDFINFYIWAMKNGYKDDLSIDRINVNGNYEPQNCRWITRKEQCFNRRNNHFLTFNGKTQTMKEWSIETGLHYDCIRCRINRYGWSTEKALTTPAKGKQNG